jgi:hypothetical protein
VCARTDQSAGRTGVDCRATNVLMAGRGRCSRCYQRHRRQLRLRGEFVRDPSWTDRRSSKRTLEEAHALLLAGREVQQNGCWHYRGKPGSDGYIWFKAPGANQAHRAMYLAHHGEILPGHYVDHMCHNTDTTCPGGKECLHRRCINPDHLQAVKPRVNLERSRLAPSTINAAKTHCPQGHPYDEGNTGITWVNDRPRRFCKSCASIRAAARYKRKKR